MQRHFKTVLGDIPENELGITLSHEHICCYSEYLYDMAKNKYLDKEKLQQVSVQYLKELKVKYNLNTFIDCTPVNIGRDIDLLKKVSQESGVNIICSTGFYYTEESLLYNLDIDCIVDCIVMDAKQVNAGIIKCAVERESISTYDEKILRATARAQLQLEIPLVLHANANNQNGMRALEILLSEGVKAQAVTVGHLSDTDDLEYLGRIAKYGCFLGFDRLYGHITEEYISKTVNKIIMLCNLGYTDRILLSHDALFFNGFEETPAINERPRYLYCFEHITPRLPINIAEQIMKENPKNMLRGGKQNAI